MDGLFVKLPLNPNGREWNTEVCVLIKLIRQRAGKILRDISPKKLHITVRYEYFILEILESRVGDDDLSQR